MSGILGWGWRAAAAAVLTGMMAGTAFAQVGFSTQVTVTPTGPYKHNGVQGALVAPIRDTATANVGDTIDLTLGQLVAFPAPYNGDGCALGVTFSASAVRADRLGTEVRAGAELTFTAAGSATTNMNASVNSGASTGAVGIGSQNSRIRLTFTQPGVYGVTVNVNTVPPGSSCPFTTFLAQGSTFPNLYAVVNVAGSTPAITPQSGWWNSATQPGRGFVLEHNPTSGNIFFSSLVYATDGAPTWYIGTCPLSASNCNGTLLQFGGGMALGGTYKAASLVGQIGAFGLSFSAANAGTLKWPMGTTTALQRFAFNGTSTPAAGTSAAPQTGWWYSATEPGGGWFIEAQTRADGRNAMFLAGLMYRNDGQAIWYLADGIMTTESTFEGTLREFAGGSSIGAATATPPATVTDRGAVSVRFPSPTNGVITLPDGKQLTVVRNVF